METFDRLSADELKKFEELGYVGPFQLFPPDEVDSITEFLKKEKTRFFFSNRILSRVPVLKNQFKVSRWGKSRWHKGIHTVSPRIYQISKRAEILSRVNSIIGDDAIIWGSLMLTITSYDNPSWHTDAECRHWDLFESASVWIALSDVDESNCMRIVTRTHNLPEVPPGLKSDNEILEAAQKLDPRCEYVAVNTKPGEFFIFANRLWHTGKKSEKVRNCLLLQYSKPTTTIRIPKSFSEPIIWDSRPVPCLLVSGKATGHNYRNSKDKKIILKAPV